MKTLIICLSLAVSLPAFAGGLLTGNALVHYQKSWERIERLDGRLGDGDGLRDAGVFEGFALCAAQASGAAIPTGAPTVQIASVLSNFLMSKPEKWGDPAFDLARDAFLAVWPPEGGAR